MGEKIWSSVLARRNLKLSFRIELKAFQSHTFMGKRTRTAPPTDPGTGNNRMLAIPLEMCTGKKVASNHQQSSLENYSEEVKILRVF